MSEVRHAECQHKPHYFAMFLSESIAGGAAPKPKKAPGLGDRLAAIFAWLGFKKRKGCGCEKRQAILNRFGAWVTGIFS